MPQPAEDPASQLRAIRGLLERGPIYRAISAQVALIAGVLSLAACWRFWQTPDPASAPRPIVWLLLWLGLLTTVALLTAVLLWRNARRRGEHVLTGGAKHALQCLLPPLVAGLLMSIITVTQEGNRAHGCHADVSAHLILFYGLALMAAGSWCPRSLHALGAGFFTMGICTFLPSVREMAGTHYPKEWQYPAAVVHMAFSFGAMHIIYAAAVWIQTRREGPARRQELSAD
jgi:hypothetical protein